MKLKYFQKGFNFSQDGPGNRLIYHLQGCNLKCPWCSNPEGIAVNGTVMATDKINGAYCIKNAVSGNTIDRNECIDCSRPCLGIPASGIKLSCVEEETSQIVDYIKTCKMMFFDGGGVTVTGGEPTIQFEALREFLTLLKKENINTCMECNATSPRLPELFELVDFLITDCKHYDSETHKKVCGLDNDIILKNIETACEMRKQLLVRIPLIGGFNSSEQDAEEFAKLFSKICNENCTFEFLRYHEFGKNKYEKCGMQYTMTQEAKVSPEAIDKFSRTFKKYKLKTIHT